MERAIVTSLVAYLEENCTIRFMAGRLTDDQLLLTYGEAGERVDSAYVVDVDLLDSTKSFDGIFHSVLLQELAALGVDDVVVQWIDIFLGNRSISAVWYGVASDLRGVGTGVPQGSVLGPVLALTYVNNITQNT